MCHDNISFFQTSKRPRREEIMDLKTKTRKFTGRKKYLRVLL